MFLSALKSGMNVTVRVTKSPTEPEGAKNDFSVTASVSELIV